MHPANPTIPTMRSVMAQEPQAHARLPALPAGAADPTDDMELLVDLLGHATNASRERVLRRLWCEHRRPGSSVLTALRQRRIEHHLWSDALEQFYRETDAFLYELVAFNRTPYKRGIQRWINRYLAGVSRVPLRVLAFGDGLGFDSLRIAAAGHQVTYHEVSELSACFAGELFRRCGANIARVSGLPSVGETYDAILCLDVLEHVPDPQQVIADLCRRLRDDGRIIVHAPFFCVSRDYPTHLRSNLRFSGDLRTVFAPAGLSPVSSRLLWDPIVFIKQPSGRSRRRVRLGAAIRVRIGQLILKSAGRWPRITRGAVRLCLVRDHLHLRRAFAKDTRNSV